MTLINRLAFNLIIFLSTTAIPWTSAARADENPRPVGPSVASALSGTYELTVRHHQGEYAWSCPRTLTIHAAMEEGRLQYRIVADIETLTAPVELDSAPLPYRRILNFGVSNDWSHFLVIRDSDWRDHFRNSTETEVLPHRTTRYEFRIHNDGNTLTYRQNYHYSALYSEGCFHSDVLPSQDQSLHCEYRKETP